MSRSILLLLVLTSFLVSCGDDDPVGPDPFADLVVSPSAGPVGTVVALRGIDASGLDAEDAELRFGDVLAPLRIEGADAFTTVPLAVDGDANLSLLPGETTVSLRVDGEVVAEVDFTVAELPAAPGAADELVAGLCEVAAGLRSFGRIDPDAASAVDGGLSSALGAIDSLLVGDGAFSLARDLQTLEDEAPAVRAVVDGLIASSGLLAQTEFLATMLETSAEERAAVLARLAPESIADDELARRMQFHVLFRLFGQQVVAESASTWANTMGLLGSTVGLVQSVPLVGRIGTILSIANFAINKVALGYLPARVESFELVLADAVVAPGEVPETELRLIARSDPPDLGLQDLISLSLTGMGALNSTQRETFRDFLLNVANWYLGRVRTLMAVYDQAHPEIEMDIEFLTFPTFRWETEVRDLRLVELLTFTPDIIAPVEQDIAAWRAGLDAAGLGRIYARLRSGPESHLLPDVPGFEYTGGAFGEDVLSTQTASVVVGEPLIVVASMAEQISEGGTNGLEVRVGTVGATGDTTWVESALVECVATGGQVSPASGLTGEDGRFDTFVTLDEGSAEVRVDVSATGDFDQQATATVRASTDTEFLRLDVSMSDRVSPDDSEYVEVEGWYVDAAGNFVRDAGDDVTVSFSVIGGTVTPSVATFEFGEAEAEVTVDENADELVLTVSAIDTRGRTASEEVTALNVARLPIMMSLNYGRVWQNVKNQGNYYTDWGGNQTGDQAYPRQFVRNPATSGEDEDGFYAGACSLAVRVEPRRSDDDLLSGYRLTGRILSRSESGGGHVYANGQIQLTVEVTVREGSWNVALDGDLACSPNPEAGIAARAYFERRVDGQRVDQRESEEGARVDLGDALTLGPGAHRIYLNLSASSSANTPSTPAVVEHFAEFDLDVTWTRTD